MKTTAVVTLACIASASAFAPSSNGARVSTSLNAAKKKDQQAPAKKSLFRTIAEMDLFAPKADQNDYGARNKKQIGTAKLGDNSYIPAGLTKAQYEAIRSADEKKKAENYQKNVAKAGKFLDYTQFYIERGTDTSEAWNKDINKGHRMAKTKYDWSGKEVDAAKGWFSK
mmetsp:Transcript_9016/g.17003  ORF Transcript_9016/g.17003 Transcript_9016/m.17003 type:complete len:169 (-) Transcript_9016:1769-2275(-)